MTRQSIYSRKQFNLAVNLSALLGWACFTIVLVSQSHIINLYWAILFGLPLSFLCCWVIGAPILKHVMRKEITWQRAAFWGGVIASLIALPRLGFGHYMGWHASINPDFHAQIGSGEHTRSIDGVLTTYGWLMQGLSTALFVALGACVAMLVRLYVGKPAAKSGE